MLSSKTGFEHLENARRLLFSHKSLRHQTIVENATDAGEPPIVIAALVDKPECIAPLVKAGCDLDAPGWHPNIGTAAHLAARKGHHLFLQGLVKAGCQVNSLESPKRWTPAIMAVFHQRPKCLKVLIAAGCDVDLPTPQGHTAACVAAEKGDYACLKALIAAGCDVNKARDDGATAAIMAAQLGHLDCLKLLVQAKCSLKGVVAQAKSHLIKDKIRVTRPLSHGWSLATIAARAGNVTALQILILAGCDMNATVFGGATPVYLAAQNGHLPCLSALIDAKCDVDLARCTSGVTPTFIAAQEGNETCVRALIDAGCDVHKETKRGYTAAVIAAQQKKQRCLIALIEAGSDVSGIDLSALPLARQALLHRKNSRDAIGAFLMLRALLRYNLARRSQPALFFGSALSSHVLNAIAEAAIFFRHNETRLMLAYAMGDGFRDKDLPTVDAWLATGRAVQSKRCVVS